MGLSTKDVKKLAKASSLSHSDDPKDQHRARARQTEVDYKDLVRQLKAKRKKKMKESFTIDKEKFKKVQKKQKMRNLAIKNTNKNEADVAHKKAGGPKLYGEEDNYGQAKKELKATKKARDERHRSIHSGTNTAKNTDVNEELTFEGWKERAVSAVRRVTKKKPKPHKYPEGGGPYVDAGAEAADRVRKKEQRKVGILPDQKGTARKDDR